MKSPVRLLMSTYVSVPVTEQTYERIQICL